jgi:hypothetical protein
MPPKADPNEEKIVILRVVGGEVGAASSLAPKIGPLGLVYLLNVFIFFIESQKNWRRYCKSNSRLERVEGCCKIGCKKPCS